MQPIKAFFYLPILLLLILLPPIAGAQTPDLATHQTAMQALSDSEWVRLASSQFGRHEGRVLEHTAAEVVLATGVQPLRIPATGIDSLWTRSRPSRTGAIAGALKGAGIGLLIATQTVEPSETPGTDYLVVLGVGGAVGGGLLGALAGKAFPGWRRRFPPQARSSALGAHRMGRHMFRTRGPLAQPVGAADHTAFGHGPTMRR